MSGKNLLRTLRVESTILFTVAGDTRTAQLHKVKIKKTATFFDMPCNMLSLYSLEVFYSIIYRCSRIHLKFAHFKANGFENSFAMLRNSLTDIQYCNYLVA